IKPDVFHMNEGHSAFLGLERIRLNVVEKKLDFYSALQVVVAANVFTTHTPVPAGNDSFPREMMRRYFGAFAKELDIPFDELFSFGQTRVDPTDPFSMTILALRLSRHANGVSKSPEVIRRVNRILDPEILTIGFARRFATYKRGTLLFSDKERLKRLLNDTTRPVQFIFAGKAHPRDEAGKALIQEVYKLSRETGFENRIVLLEDYD